MISIRNVSKWYGDVQTLNDCSMDVAKGEIVVVCGASGSGKSTLVNCVNGLERFQKGEITVDGISVSDPRTDLSRLRTRVGTVFQNFELFSHLTVIENLALAQIKVLGRSRAAATAKALNHLDYAGLLRQGDKYPAQLSSGEQQCVAIARALCMDPSVMLFDEPTSALDPTLVNDILEAIVRLGQQGMTMVVVTDEMAFARRIGQRVVFMDAGQIVEDTAKDEFFTAPRSERARQFLSKVLRS
jgi:glutamate/aspartate transport system ATP-binding protein